jgi:pyruvate/2-oxoglutarate dehydrogenase complex dihydrolipoamide acyltransferase (E2) component
MPRLSDSMEDGLIVRWLRADGRSVARDEELVEIETDKATMVYESPAAGTLQILAVGAARALPVVRDGVIVAGHEMRLSLTCDHRILYGADGAQFLGRSSAAWKTRSA